jgi:hypothetical protein
MALFGTGAVTFTGTQFTELAAFDASFSKQTGYTQDGILGAGGTYAIQNGGVGPACYQYAATPPSANYSVWADIAKLSGSTGSGPRMGVAGRMASGAETFYFALYSHDATNVRLFKVVAGTQTQLGSSYTYTATSTAAKLELVMDGSSISVKLNDTTVIGPVTDTAITAAGRAGVYLFDMRETGVADSGSLDNFDAAAIGGGPTGSFTLDDFPFTGGFASAPASSLLGTLTLDNFVLSGTLGLLPGRVDTPPFKNWTGTLLPGTTVPNVVFLRLDRTTALSLTNQTTAGDAVLTVENASLVSGVAYIMVTYNADGTIAGAQRVVAA